jgi:serine/threonine protein kinase
MTERPDAWRQLQALFELIDRTPAAERHQVLDSACPDAEMRARVLRVVWGANQDRHASTAPGEPDRVASSVVPLQFGPYRVLAVIGSGGIGTVYLAERLMGGAPQRVAIKVLSPHAAGRHFVERFHREQHILAMLDHPNITRLRDAGLSENGQPYLVMDFVAGVHLDDYCDREHLSVDARMRLFLQICEAIAHAHRNLVVHLDLKPSNILVTAAGAVKLLDFGTSKLLQPDESVTSTILATPAYASPEQLRNEPLTTACDIYSLGAILFFLLTGEVEGGRRSAAVAIERAFKETQPQRLAAAQITEDVARTRATQQWQGNTAASLPLYQKAYDGIRRCAGPDSPDALQQQEFLAGALVKAGRGPEALALMNDALPKWRKVNGTGPNLAQPLNFMIMAELATGHAVEAEAHAREMVAVQTGQVDPHDRRFGASHLLWAKALLQLGRFADALPHARIADDLLAKGAISQGAKEMTAEAHQVLLDVESRVAASTPSQAGHE